MNRFLIFARLCLSVTTALFLCNHLLLLFFFVTLSYLVFFPCSLILGPCNYNQCRNDMDKATYDTLIELYLREKPGIQP